MECHCSVPADHSSSLRANDRSRGPEYPRDHIRKKEEDPRVLSVLAQAEGTVDEMEGVIEY